MPDFRIRVIKACVASGGLIRYIHLFSKRGKDWYLCGLLTVNNAEWERLSLICELTSIEIEDNAPVSP